LVVVHGSISVEESMLFYEIITLAIAGVMTLAGSSRMVSNMNIGGWWNEKTQAGPVDCCDCTACRPLLSEQGVFFGGAAHRFESLFQTNRNFDGIQCDDDRRRFRYRGSPELFHDPRRPVQGIENH
jgi:hypothetical protein